MKGVTVFLQKQSDGKHRLIINDVVASSDTDKPDWKHSILYTYNNYDSVALKNMSLSQEQFAEIGQNIIARLIASEEFN